MLGLKSTAQSGWGRGFWFWALQLCSPGQLCGLASTGQPGPGPGPGSPVQLRRAWGLQGLPRQYPSGSLLICSCGTARRLPGRPPKWRDPGNKTEDALICTPAPPLVGGCRVPAGSGWVCSGGALGRLALPPSCPGAGQDGHRLPPLRLPPLRRPAEEPPGAWGCPGVTFRASLLHSPRVTASGPLCSFLPCCAPPGPPRSPAPGRAAAPRSSQLPAGRGPPSYCLLLSPSNATPRSNCLHIFFPIPLFHLFLSSLQLAVHPHGCPQAFLPRTPAHHTESDERPGPVHLTPQRHLAQSHSLGPAVPPLVSVAAQTLGFLPSSFSAGLITCFSSA